MACGWTTTTAFGLWPQAVSTGDGRDEIVAVPRRPDSLFPDAHNSTSHQTINVPTDRRNLLIGDLDRNGFISGPVLGATPGRIDETVYMGFVREEASVCRTQPPKT
jgi:hypothetical protein